MVRDRAGGRGGVVVPESAQVGVGAQHRVVAAGPHIQHPLAAVALRDPSHHRPFPARGRRGIPGTLGYRPAVVADGRGLHPPRHRVRRIGRVVVVDEVVDVDLCAGCDPPDADAVVARGDEASGAGAVGIAGIEHAAVAVGVVALGQDVGRQVRVPGVKAVVDQGHGGAPPPGGRPSTPPGR